MLLHKAAAEIEELHMQLQEARKDTSRLLLAAADLDGFLFDPMNKTDYIDQVAGERGHAAPTDEDVLEAIRRMIDYQLTAFAKES
ncbi:hypothetical protein NCCP691_38200 [Noviherbaspirillum aridicola]|uniref:Uncharacterized protein n=2 Tax=Noviherbaspirillum aridicola TaxID=2849687 RepID=A0ABQ4Q9B8_9BURK|nr:hypothetical protein NCCP691_38200 [Noviherbaspirillum aridicola]